LSPNFAEKTFAFMPPPNAHRIDFDVAQAPAASPQQRQGRAPASRMGGTP